MCRTSGVNECDTPTQEGSTTFTRPSNNPTIATLKHVHNLIANRVCQRAQTWVADELWPQCGLFRHMPIREGCHSNHSVVCGLSFGLWCPWMIYIPGMAKQGCSAFSNCHRHVCSSFCQTVVCELLDHSHVRKQVHLLGPGLREVEGMWCGMCQQLLPGRCLVWRWQRSYHKHGPRSNLPITNKCLFWGQGWWVLNQVTPRHGVLLQAEIAQATCHRFHSVFWPFSFDGLRWSFPVA